MPPTAFTWLPVLAPVLALGASLHAPIRGREQHDLERLAAVSSLPSVKQPYPAELLARALSEIEIAHPRLHHRLHDSPGLAGESRHYRPSDPARSSGWIFTLHDVTVEGGAHCRDDETLARAFPNEHGRTIDGNLTARGALSIRPAAGVAVALGADLARRVNGYEFRFSNTYLSAGFPFLQLDVGFRDHWYSPAYNGAIAVSTHAVNSPSITFSNSRPLTRARLMYELFLSRLEETDRIYVSRQPRTGHPNLLGLHFSFSPTSWLTLGGNRMLQFGGEPRPSVSAWEVIRALVDPNRYDNVSGELNRDDEIGNQIGSIAVAANYALGRFPMRFYWELGADDTGSGRTHFFGNPLTTVGLFAPFVTERLSLRYEFTEGQNWWYEHSIYREGYRNGDRVMGHWIYDFNAAGYAHEIEARMHALSTVWTDEKTEAAITARLLSINLLRVIVEPGEESPPPVEYSDGWEIDLALRRQLRDHLDGRLRLFAGRTPVDQAFANFTLGIGIQ